MYSKVCFMLVLCVVFVSSQSLTGNEKKCAKNGEYCQVHWDCCSNTCLTYLYKCTETNNPLNKPPSEQIADRFNAEEPSMTLDQLIALLFGGAQRPTNTATNQPFFGPCKTNGARIISIAYMYQSQCFTASNESIV